MPVGAIRSTERSSRALPRSLVLARRPSARRKPAAETVRQQFGRFGRRSGADADGTKDVSRRGGYVEGGNATNRSRPPIETTLIRLCRHHHQARYLYAAFGARRGRLQRSEFEAGGGDQRLHAGSRTQRSPSPSTTPSPAWLSTVNANKPPAASTRATSSSSGVMSCT